MRLRAWSLSRQAGEWRTTEARRLGLGLRRGDVAFGGGEK